jgi:ABC-type antimicrobial peptide transport system permease subunit
LLEIAQAEFGFYPDWGMDVVVRAEGDLQQVAPLARSVMRELDPALPLFAARPLAELVQESLGARRRVLALLGSFSVLALALATIGLYGVLSQLARERTREFGVRLALGARAGQLGAMLLRDGLGLTGLGVALGAGLAFVAGRVLGTLLHGVEPGDPATLVAAAGLLVAAATVAALPTLRRVRRLHPAAVLRDE